MKRLLLIILLLSLTGCTQKFGADEKIADNLKLKTSVNNILAEEDLPNNIKRYSYIKDKEILPKEIKYRGKFLNELVNRRTINSRFWQYSTSTYLMETITGDAYYKDEKTGKYYEIGLATTTKSEFNKQIQDSSIISSIFGKTALATVLSTSTNSGDGNCRSLYGSSWSVARAKTSCNDFDSTFFGEKEGTSKYNLSRFFFGFNTSELPDNATISSSTVLCLYLTNIYNNSEGTYPADITLTGNSRASQTTLSVNDFDDILNVKYSDTIWDIIDWKDWIDKWYYFPLNATGIAAISKTGYTGFALKPNNDYSDSTAPTARSYVAAPVSSAVSAPIESRCKILIEYTISTIESYEDNDIIFIE